MQLNYGDLQRIRSDLQPWLQVRGKYTSYAEAALLVSAGLS